MKQLSPPVAIAIIAVAVLAIALIAWKMTGVGRSQEGQAPPGVPPDIAQKMGAAMKNAPQAARATPTRP